MLWKFQQRLKGWCSVRPSPLHSIRPLSDCRRRRQRLINEQWQERWLPASQRPSRDRDSPEAKDKGGKGKGYDYSAEIESPLFYLDNLGERESSTIPSPGLMHGIRFKSSFAHLNFVGRFCAGSQTSKTKK